MEENKSFNRGWVKNAAIIFLSVMLVLTFFSNTFLNHSLPEVATQYITSGTITTRVRVTGAVTPNESYNVVSSSSREVLSVKVQVGDEVKPGDVLFVMGEGDALELEQAQQQLDSLRLEYQTALINASSSDYAKENRDIAKAREALAEAQVELEQAYREYTSPHTAADAAVELERALDAAEAALSQAEDALTVARMNYGEDYRAMQQVAIAENGRATDVYMQYLAYEYSEYQKNNPGGSGSGEDGSSEDSGTVYATDKEPSINKKMYTAYMAITTAEENLATAQTAYDQAYDNYHSALETAREDSEEARKQAYEAAKLKVSTCEDTLSDLVFALEEQQKADGKTQQIEQLNLNNMRKRIAEQEAVVKKLSGSGEDGGNEITANVGGIISAVNVSAGKTVMADETMATIEVPDMGYAISAPVTLEQAKKVRVGDEATVSNYYWGAEIHARLSAIKPDPTNPQSSRLLQFDITGDVTTGTNLTLSVGQRSAEYDCIVPNSAIRSDNNGNFVLIIRSKSSPLGNRYYAQRADVEILASDDTNTAVSGGVSAYDYVITTSTKPISNGDQVRMPD